MRRSIIPSALLAACLGVAFVGCATPEQKAARAERRMTATEFLKTHEYDHINNTWVNKGGGPATDEVPPDVRSRADVKAERDAFLAKNRWDNVNSVWVPVQGPPRDLSTMSREQVKAETQQYLKTHEYDEFAGKWVDKK
jgi:hypothetical protein